MENLKSTKEQSITYHSSLGKEIKISPKSLVSVNKKGFKQEFFTPTVSLIIGIGKDHCAELIMNEEAWKALNENEIITITTLKAFEDLYIKKL